MTKDEAQLISEICVARKKAREEAIKANGLYNHDFTEAVMYVAMVRAVDAWNFKVARVSKAS